eukprot:9448535-Alexandrium_andersonii.AAC.1
MQTLPTKQAGGRAGGASRGCDGGRALSPQGSRTIAIISVVAPIWSGLSRAVQGSPRLSRALPRLSRALRSSPEP